IVRTGHQHLVAFVEQRSQYEVDQLADTVADENLFGRYSRYTARLLLHHNGFTGGENTLLVAVPFGVRQVLDHGEPHRLRRAEPEGARIADVQRDDLVAHPLHFMGAPGQAPADLVAHVAKALAGTNTDFGLHGAKDTALARLRCDGTARPLQIPPPMTRHP